MRIAQGMVPSVTMAGVSIPLSSAIILASGATTALRYTTLRKAGAVYQVPAGFKLVIYAQRIVNTSAVSESAAFGYGDTGVNNSASAPTNNVGITIGAYSGNFPTSATAYNITESVVNIEIAAGKYPYTISDGAFYGIYLARLVAV
jgi:hypothetical protein